MEQSLFNIFYNEKYFSHCTQLHTMAHGESFCKTQLKENSNTISN